MKKLAPALFMLAVLCTANTCYAQIDLWFLLLTMIPQQQTQKSQGLVIVNTVGTPAYTTDFNSLEPLLNTDDKLVSYMESNFTYVTKWYSPTDIAQTPAQTNALKTGNCADFAVFSSSILADNGYEGVQIISYRFDPRANLGHDVTIFNENGYDWIISNTDEYGPTWDGPSLNTVLRKVTGSTTADRLKYFPAGTRVTYF